MKLTVGSKVALLVIVTTPLLAAVSSWSVAETPLEKLDWVTPVGLPSDRQAKAVVDAGEVKAEIKLSLVRSLGGQRVDVSVDFDIAPGWHVYGKPLPEEYTPVSVIFDNDLLSKQTLVFPKPTPVRFDVLGETMPVYQGHFKAVGDVVLRRDVMPGEHRLVGTVSFQQCNENLCKMPQQLHFEIPFVVLSPAKVG